MILWEAMYCIGGKCTSANQTYLNMLMHPNTQTRATHPDKNSSNKVCYKWGIPIGKDTIRWPATMATTACCLSLRSLKSVGDSFPDPIRCQRKERTPHWNQHEWKTHQHPNTWTTKLASHFNQFRCSFTLIPFAETQPNPEICLI